MHKTVSGITQSGKTYGIFDEVEHDNVPTIFVNLKEQPIEVVKDYVTVTASHTFAELKYALKNHKMINYMPKSEETLEREINALCDFLLELQKKGTFKKVKLIVDEAWLVIPQGNTTCKLNKIARIGASLGIELIIICQSIADVDKKVVKQCEIIKIYKLNDWDYRYLKNIGLDADEIKRLIKGSPKYSHVLASEGQIQLKKAS